MLLSDISIKRPVVAIVASLLLVVFGLFAGMRLPVRETPDIDRPVVNVRVNYTGASAEVIESQVVRVIEERIGGVQGIETINAYSFDGGGNVNIEFKVGRDIDEAANDVRDQVSRVVGRLPQDADPPVVQKADPDSQPIMWINVYSTSRDAMELSDYVHINLEPRFSTVQGVASLRIGGDREKAMRVWLDRRAMAARGITVTDVESALRQENVELGAGMLESADRNYTLRTIRAYQTVEDFQNLVVARGENNYLIRLAEIANVEIAPVDDKQVFRQGGRPGIGIGIIKQPGASTLDVSAAVRAEIAEIQRTMPDDLAIGINNDSADYISAALREVVIAMVVAAAMVVAVIYLFLGTARAAIIPAVTVPISLISTAIVLWPLGFSINILTLLAMVLAIGLVVDDAIIMLENIHRRMKLGEPPLLAAYRGARQVGMAVVSTTLVLIAAFIPVTLMEGTVGTLFFEFAVSMAVAVAFSMFVSLTLTPVMCSKILTPKLDTSPVAHKANEIFERLKSWYIVTLDKTLDKPWRVLAGFAGIIVLAGGMFMILPQEFTPKEDRGMMFIQIRPPEASTASYTDRQVKEAADILKPYIDSGEVERLLERVDGDNGGGNILVILAPWADRDRHVTAFLDEVAPKLNRVTGARVSPNLPSALGQRGGGFNNLNFALTGPTYDELRVWRDDLMTALSQSPYFVNVNNSFRENNPQIRIRIDRTRASDLGVSVGAIGQTLAAMLGSRRVTTFVDSGEEYDVILQGRLQDRQTPTDISNIYVRSGTSRELIPLSSVVTLEEGTYSDFLPRLDRRRAIFFNLFPAGDANLAELVAEVERIAEPILPETARIIWRGEAADYKETGYFIYFSFGLALLVVFLVLAAQFESFVHPFIIMMTVPLAVFGALVGLLLFGQSINIYSQIGIIVLVGLAAKNGILIVEFANQMRDAGRPFRQALIEGAVTRLRPIIMTALATIMGAVPLILASGAGAEGRQPIGVTVFTGVAFAAVITLVVVPAFYMLLAKGTGSPGRVAAELHDYEKKHPASAGSTGQQPAE